MEKISMLAFHPVKMHSCYEKVVNLSLEGLQQQFDVSSPSVFVQRAQIPMREVKPQLLTYQSNIDCITANKKKGGKVGENHDSSQHKTISHNFAMEGQILTKQVTIDDGPLLKMSMQKL
ncbi:hypothetical protein JOB18_037785 [Solea senegalensis]|uniref:Niban 1/2/3 domain-containing protein n=1 Tax=Solea senegalensis TaxID=28829 RepID=A0AAV6PP10_SOLSE|nr:hypothetical protein JOB18_037785 [Solea senegalensis]